MTGRSSKPSRARATGFAEAGCGRPSDDGSLFERESAGHSFLNVFFPRTCSTKDRQVCAPGPRLVVVGCREVAQDLQIDAAAIDANPSDCRSHKVHQINCIAFARAADVAIASSCRPVGPLAWLRGGLAVVAISASGACIRRSRFVIVDTGFHLRQGPALCAVFMCHLYLGVVASGSLPVGRRDIYVLVSFYGLNLRLVDAA